MVKIGLLLVHHYRLLSVAAILDVFETVNQLAVSAQENLPFEICFYQQPADFKNGFFENYAIRSTVDTDDLPDLILIPSFKHENISTAIQDNLESVGWLKKRASQGAEIATFCTGAFLLGASGLLSGKIATTHVDACTAFRTAFPDVNLRSDLTVTQDGNLYTSGGATSSFHLMLHLIRKFCGSKQAIAVAKIFAIDMDRKQQSYFSTFNVERTHLDPLVKLAQEKIEEGYQQTVTIEELIRDIPSSRRNMLRRFKLVTGITPIEYLQQTRIAAAKKLLEQTAEQMNEVIYKSGYSDPKAFRKVFKKNVGMTPKAYRDKFYYG